MPDYLLTSSNIATRQQKFALWILTRFGWRVNFAPLPGRHGVVIVYPHTSNWDFIIGLLEKWVIGIHFRWLGKESLFSGVPGVLLGPFLRAWGGEPVERAASTGAIERLAQRIQSADSYWLVLTPEGMRKYRQHWRSGFYHVALTAKVPLGIARIDYGTREVRLVDYVMLSGDIEADLTRIRTAYHGCRGLKPEWAAPIDFASADPKNKQGEQAGA
jgi:1-acyl-sn-glycerol-3-phosphate acyltransferase